MGNRSTNHANYHSVRHTSAPPPQPNAQSEIGDWRRTAGLYSPPESVSQYHPAGQASTIDRTATSTPVVPTPAPSSTTDSVQNEHSGPHSYFDSSSDNRTRRRDVNSGCDDGSEYGDDNNGGSTEGSSSSATSISAATTNGHCDRAETILGINQIEGDSGGMVDPDIPRSPATYQRHLKERLHLLARRSGEEYEASYLSHTAPSTIMLTSS